LKVNDRTITSRNLAAGFTKADGRRLPRYGRGCARQQSMSWTDQGSRRQLDSDVIEVKLPL
jgi:hypothetical protein